MPLLLEVMCRKARSKQFPKGQIIVYQGDTPLEALVLTTGIVKIYDIDEQGNEKILHLLKPWSIIPFAFFSGDHQAVRWFYAALTDCEVSVIPFEKLSGQMQRHSEFAIELMNWFSREVHELLVRLSSMNKTNTRDKMLAALKFLAVHEAVKRRSGWWRVSFPVNQQLMADLTGMTRESAATILKSLQDEKIIRHPRMTILEIDFDALLKA